MSDIWVAIEIILIFTFFPIFIRKHKIDNLFYSDDRIYKYCKKNNINVLQLARKLQILADEQKLYMHGFSNTKMGIGHLNENAHSFAGSMIASYLCSEDVISGCLERTN